MKKQLISLLLTLIMCVSLSTEAIAVTAESGTLDNERLVLTPSYDETLLEQNRINASSYALSFVETFTEDVGYMSGDTITMLSASDGIAGFCVDIYKNSQQYGYVIVKFVNNEPVISEFCLEEGILNPYATMLCDYDLQGRNLQFYSIGANDYQIYDRANGYAKNVYGESFSSLEFAEYKSSEALCTSAEVTASNSNDWITYSDLDGYSVISSSYEGTVNSSKTITGAGSIEYYGTSEVSNIDRQYACAVVSISNLMKYCRSRGKSNINSSFVDLYDSIWQHAGTSSSGSTTPSKEPKAVKSYLNEVGYSCSYTSFQSYGVFQSNLNLNKPCLFSYGAVFNGNSGGHSVFVAGYVDTTAYQYLRIADGWNKSLRYINFNGYNYSRTMGWSFAIS